MIDRIDIVFLDRDGTLNHDEGYMSDPDRLVLLPGAAEAVAALNAAGVKAVVITNQSGVGRGLVSREALARVHERLAALLAQRGARLDGIYSCVHCPEEGCDCRKPGTALAVQAARDLGVDVSRSAMIGDKSVDLELGRRLGGRTVLVRSGEGRKTETELSSSMRPNHIADTIYEAVQWLGFGARP
ncbi:MAG: D-glycero-alpha-D-manno-heptose-1,7-bisphosphate 7-phosphatase [Nitrospirota bacterium]